MSVSPIPIEIDKTVVAAYCRSRGIRKLSLFGSILREDFDPATSDLDVLVEYLPGRHPGLNHFLFQDELTTLLDRHVDLCTPAMLSRFFREEILAEARPLYEQA